MTGKCSINFRFSEQSSCRFLGHSSPPPPRCPAPVDEEFLAPEGSCNSHEAGSRATALNESGQPCLPTQAPGCSPECPRRPARGRSPSSSSWELGLLPHPPSPPPSSLPFSAKSTALPQRTAKSLSPEPLSTMSCFLSRWGRSLLI